MSRFARLSLAALALAAFAAAPSGSRATTLAELSVSDMAMLSDLVVTATVESVDVERMPGAVTIRSVATLRVEDTIQGRAPADGRLHVRWIGGTLDGEITHLPAVARYTPGERILAFLELRADPEGLYRTVGMRQGKFTRVLEPDTGRDILVQVSAPAGLASFDESQVQLPARRAYADDLIDRLLDEAALGYVPEYRPIPGATAEKDAEFRARALAAGQRIDPRLLDRPTPSPEGGER